MLFFADSAQKNADNPHRIKELMGVSLPEGAEAFGMQIEMLKSEFRNVGIYKELFSYTDRPIYVTNYRNREMVVRQMMNLQLKESDLLEQTARHKNLNRQNISKDKILNPVNMI